MRKRSITALLLGFSASACELTEVGIAPGEDLLVVESLLRAGDSRQAVLLHHSLQGRVVAGEPEAHVTLAGPQGEAAVLAEAPLGACLEGIGSSDSDSIVVRATCYQSPALSPAGDLRPGGSAIQGIRIEPGQTYELRIAARDGRQLRGRTTVPGEFRLRSPTDGLARCALPPGTNLPLVWSVARGAWSYISVMEITGLREALAPAGIDAPERLELTGVAVSANDTTLVVPADFGLFDLDGANRILALLQRGFPSGVSARVTIVAADRNYVNSVRGGGFNPSGNVRISSVVGDGLGLFGSAVQREINIVVGDDLPFPQCQPV